MATAGAGAMTSGRSARSPRRCSPQWPRTCVLSRSTRLSWASTACASSTSSPGPRERRRAGGWRVIMSTSRTVVFDLAGDIDDTGYATIRALDGTAIRVEQWNNEASWDSIRHYALGLGDDNPLFCDPGYAQGTPYGTILAPP